MIGLYFFGLVALWLMAGTAFGWWIYRKTDNRGWQLIATIFALWLPLWDVIPGYVLYRKAVRDVGGFASIGPCRQTGIWTIRGSSAIAGRP